MDISENEMTDSDGIEAATHHGKVAGVVGTVALCAFSTFFMGAMCGAPWPAAVASCGLSLMGLGVAYFMLRRA